ncbi:hypothetical protein KDAU_52200 [Dictyobacter aurantiacus]|uniref:Uncharacterized protein n=1 Tax=Dictyobacter aurantiacus TaxID=1936993 RepID=A0A401ZLY5_9CHLR|nr:hypothetical protein KDAU_52200 [Dictyobacter aurantiacus]
MPRALARLKIIPEQFFATPCDARFVDALKAPDGPIFIETDTEPGTASADAPGGRWFWSVDGWR